MNDVKDKLNQAFALLRKKGYIARQNFSCCRNCAGYELATNVSSMPDSKRVKVRGCVFYTRQDGEAFAEPRGRARFYRKPAEGLYLSFGPLDTTAHGQVGVDTKQVGEETVEACRAFGLNVEWDGNPNTRIFVKFASTNV